MKLRQSNPSVFTHKWSGGRAAEKTEGRTGHKKEEEGGQIDFFVKRLRLGLSRRWKIQQMTQPKIEKGNVNRKLHGPTKSRNTAKT